MRRMSFAMTVDQMRFQEKTVTRRFGWWFLEREDLVQPVVKTMGLKKGEHQVLIGGPIRILSAMPEPLDSITFRDCYREGFPEMTPDQFVTMIAKHYQCTRTAICNRIEFEYTGPIGMA